MSVPKFLRLLAVIPLLLGLVAPAWSDVKVLTSIKPLSLIAAEVMGDRGEVDTLLPVAASPHDYPLRVSDIRRLRDADLIVWVGKELEGFLYRPLSNIDQKRQLSVFSLSDIHWPEATHEGHHEHEEDGHHHHGHHHHHDGKDPHLWLDPRNAGVIALEIAKRLGVTEPDSAAYYLNNARRFNSDMQVLDKHLAERLKPVRERGFAVYHEGYQHFVTRYQLQQIGYVTYSPEQRPGAKHLYQLRQNLKGEARCLFTEPYYDQRTARELGQELNLKIGVLDPIGGETVVRYHQIVENMAGEFLTCLD